jgi:predicted RNA binding protein YcfA (HicA-like mRNA interferase family)
MKERLPSLTARKVLQALDRAGFVQSRTSGSHVRLVKASDPTHGVTVPLHGGKDLRRSTVRSIIKQAGLTLAEFLELL